MPPRNSSGRFVGSTDPVKKAVSKRRSGYARTKTVFTNVAEIAEEHEREAIVIMMDKNGKVTFGATPFFKDRLNKQEPILTVSELSNRKKVSPVDMAKLIQKAKAKQPKKSKPKEDLTPSKGSVFTSFLPKAKEQLTDLSTSVVCPDSSPEKVTVKSPKQAKQKSKKGNGVRKRLQTMYLKKANQK